MGRKKITAGGFTYLGLVFLLALLGVAAFTTALWWSTQAQREREAELIFIGHEFREALRSYAAAQPKDVTERYPQALEDLLRDPKRLEVRRYLRRVYVDPMTGRTDWVLMRTAQGGIVGLHSSSQKKPLKQAGFDEVDATFAGKSKYADWVFSPDSNISAGLAPRSSN
jgi:type II secretory pathway pseudopilin PulG